MTSIIRPAIARDVPSLLPMVAKICAMHGAMDPDKYSFLPRIDERYRAWLTQRAVDPRSVLLVADFAGKIGGFIVGSIEAEIPIYTLKEFGFVHDLWVELEHRRTG